jgi:hypothetical protein
MSLKPLYLEPGRAWHVRLDGPALRIETDGRAATRVPLRRLARVVSPQDAQWTTPALISCLKSGVTVVFTDSVGRVQAWCFGPRRRETTLTGLLREGLGRLDGTDIYGDWYRSTEQREIAAAFAHLRIVHNRHDPQDARGRLCNRHRLRFGLPIGPFLASLEAATEAYVAQQLHAAVADAVLIGYAREGLNLARSVAALMHWELHRILHDTPVSRLRDVHPYRFAAIMVEENGTRLARTLGRLLGDLERRYREWLL